MLKFVTSLFRSAPQMDWAGLLQNKGAVIIDVRTPAEYESGHIKGSKNIPLHILSQKTNQLSRTRPVIVVCRSGSRSKMAESMLREQGFEVYNGGAWEAFRQKAG